MSAPLEKTFTTETQRTQREHREKQVPPFGKLRVFDDSASRPLGGLRLRSG